MTSNTWKSFFYFTEIFKNILVCTWLMEVSLVIRICLQYIIIIHPTICTRIFTRRQSFGWQRFQFVLLSVCVCHHGWNFVLKTHLLWWELTQKASWSKHRAVYMSFCGQILARAVFHDRDTVVKLYRCVVRIKTRAKWLNGDGWCN